MPKLRAAGAHTNYTPTEDDLLKTAQIVGVLDTLDTMDRRDQQATYQQQQLQVDRDKLEFSREAEKAQASRFVEAQRIETERLRLDQKTSDLNLRNEAVEVSRVMDQKTQMTRASSALSEIYKQLPTINFDNPADEIRYGELKALAKDNFVDEKGIQTAFGTYDQILGNKKGERNTIRATQLGEEGLAVYESLLKNTPGLSTDKAYRLSKNSETAKATYYWWQDYAAKKGIAFAPDAKDQASLIKKIGTDVPTQTPVMTGKLEVGDLLDLREEVWDLKTVNALVAKYITPKLAGIEAQDAADALAVTEGKAANTRQSNALASKTEVETELLKFNRPDRFPKGQPQQSVSDKDRPQEGGTTMPTVGSILFAGPTPTPAPTPTPTPTPTR